MWRGSIYVMDNQKQDAENKLMEKVNILFVERPGGRWIRSMATLSEQLYGYRGKAVMIDFCSSTVTAARAVQYKDKNYYHMAIIDASALGMEELSDVDLQIILSDNMAEVLDKKSDFTPDDLAAKLRNKQTHLFRIIGLCDDKHDLPSANRKLYDKSPIGELTQYVTEWL
jgi:hypothetical protein